MASSKKATTQKDNINYTKTDKENLNKALDLMGLYGGGTIDGQMVFSKKHNHYIKKYYMCNKCTYARECNSMRHAKMVERLHKKKCKGATK